MSDTGQRRLTAILSADVVGYSRLIAADEEGTVDALQACRVLVRGCVERHRGRLADFVGDNFLAEFPSALDAVQCAAEIQSDLADRNTRLPPERRIVFRIGAHLGDVREKDGNIYGEGINIAARLEPLADAGGLCLSEALYASVRNRVAWDVVDAGEHTLKNIDHPVKAYRVAAEQFPASAAAVLDDDAPAAAAVTDAPAEKKPAIAILPFANMSGDPDQEYFADGMTEDIITDLAKVGGLLVIARNSAFTYKGKAVDVRTVARDLDVTHVVEGSVRKAGDRIRIAAQLIDATTGHHVWADRYDRTMTDIFALQDEITFEIVKALRVTLTAGERRQVQGIPTTNLEAYDLYLRARAFHIMLTVESLRVARDLFQKAIDLDPSFGLGYAGLARAHWEDFFSQRTTSLAMPIELAEKALSLDEQGAYTHAVLCLLYGFDGRVDEARHHGKRAVELSPNDATALAMFGGALSYAGQVDEGLPIVERSVRLDPHEYTGHLVLGQVCLYQGKLEEALTHLTRARDIAPEFIPGYIPLGLAYELAGRPDDAAACVRRVRELNPGYTLAGMRRVYGKLPPEAGTDLLVDLARRHGMPAGEDT